MFEIFAVETNKRVAIVEGYEFAESLCYQIEKMGKHCAELIFDDYVQNDEDFACLD